VTFAGLVRAWFVRAGAGLSELDCSPATGLATVARGLWQAPIDATVTKADATKSPAKMECLIFKGFAAYGRFIELVCSRPE
jgi:hypothetical protein